MKYIKRSNNVLFTLKHTIPNAYMYYSSHLLYVILYTVCPCVTHSIPEITSVRHTTHTCTVTPGLCEFSPDFPLSGVQGVQALAWGKPEIHVCTAHIYFTHMQLLTICICYMNSSRGCYCKMYLFARNTI